MKPFLKPGQPFQFSCRRITTRSLSLLMKYFLVIKTVNNPTPSATPQFCSNSDTDKASTQQDLGSRSGSSKVEDDPELDLNLKSVKDNYEELCHLIVRVFHIVLNRMRQNNNQFPTFLLISISDRSSLTMLSRKGTEPHRMRIP